MPSQMPEGVEHRVTGWLAADVGVVTNYLMPEGVEHSVHVTIMRRLFG